MANYTQEKQRMRVETVLDEDALLLERLTGHEGLSTPFLFELDFVSEDPGIDGEKLLRSEIRVEIDLPDGEVQPIHGIVRRFSQQGQDRDLVSYRAEIVPWLWFLSLQQDCRIFQEMDVLEIVEQVFTEQGYSAFDFRCTQGYPKRDYCVQYRESNLNFVSRLLEEEGIFYFFEHGDSGHVLVLADDATSIKECEGQPEARIHTEPVPDEDVVLELRREHAVHPGKVTLADYDYLQPSLNLRSTVSGNEPEEVYDFPGSFTTLDDGDRNARLNLEREEAQRHVVRGSSTCRGFHTGGRFRLLDHYMDEANQAYTLVEVRHQAHNAGYRAGRGGDQLDYRNEFVAIPHSVPYRPLRRAEKPVVQGAQTAEVVGPSGEPVWVDEHGRVKVQFHWDRKGGRDESSSCWVRVSQAWAGKNWGGMFIPHIGQEVIVDFLEGDPDRPIITGRVYNAEQTPPLPLPSNQHKSVIQDDFGNEIIFDATPGGEHVRVHSPNHRSSVEIGKSLKWSTVSDWVSHVKGDSGFIHEGSKIAGVIGFKGTVDLGGNITVLGGYKLDAHLGEKITVQLGPTFKWAKGKEHTTGGSSWAHHYSGRIVLNSDDEIVLVGGGNDESVVAGDSKSLTLQYGENPAAEKAKADVAQKLSVVAGTLGGITSSVVATQAWQGMTGDEKDGETDQMDYYILGAGGVGGLLPSATTALVQKLISLKKDKAGPGEHNTVHSTVNLDNSGIQLEAGKTKVTIQKDGNVIINTKERVAINGDKGVGLFSDQELTFKAPKVVAKKGIFESKNINDLGA